MISKPIGMGSVGGGFGVSVCSLGTDPTVPIDPTVTGFARSLRSAPVRPPVLGSVVPVGSVGTVAGVYRDNKLEAAIVGPRS